MTAAHDLASQSAQGEEEDGPHPSAGNVVAVSWVPASRQGQLLHQGNMRFQSEEAEGRAQWRAEPWKEQQGLQQLDWQQQGLQQLHWQQQGLQQLDWQQQGLQQLDWQQDPQPEEQQQGLQQLHWEQPQEPQPPLEPPQEPQLPLEPPQEPQPPLEPPQEPQPPLEPPQEHSPPWSPHKSHSPPWSPHRSHSWSRNRLAHSSTRACSSRQAHSSWSHSPHSRSHSPHSGSHSPHSRSYSPHSRSHSLQSSHSSPWFWWIEGGLGRGAGEREVQVWSSLSRGPLYTCPDVRQDTGSLSCWARGHMVCCWLAMAVGT
ncbi:putative uncharacterized protein DDB_G0291608 [Symphalangus syndactylus]|uniref:putative uncharacterized protein DDB_G0291608 n=1 Tax=Symphalangus syndactylus TaxID=9590 RepID=UPI0030051E67